MIRKFIIGHSTRLMAGFPSDCRFMIIPCQVIIFVTVCTKNKECLFGDIKNNKIKLSRIGKIVKKCWLDIPKHYSNVKLDEWIIMPNHIHGIIEITGDNLVTPRCAVGVQNFEPLQNKRQNIIPRSLGCIIRGFKTGVTKLSKQNNIYFQWQRNYGACPERM